MQNSAVMMKTTRWSWFLRSESASRPSRWWSVRCSADLGGATLGSRNVNAATTSHVTAPVYPARADVSAFSALTSQQPATQPRVAIARIGPNSCLASVNRAKTIVDNMLEDGAEQRA